MSAITYPAQMETNLIDLIGGIRRRLWMVIIFTAAGLLLGFLANNLFPRKYEAQSLIALQTSEQNFGSTGNTTQTLLPPVESIVLSQVEVLQSRELAESLLQDLQLDTDAAFWAGGIKPTTPALAREKALQILAHDLNVRAVGRSLVIDVRFRHQNPVLAAKITNRLTEIYQEQQVKDKIVLSNKTSQWLEQRLETLSKKLRDSARAVEEYLVKEDLTDGAKAEMTSQQISELSSQLVLVQADHAAILAKKVQVDEMIQKNIPLDTTADARRSRLINILKHDESVLQSQLAQLQSKYGHNHPKILAVTAELQEIRRKQKSEVGQVTDKINSDLTSIEARMAILKKNLQELEEKRRRENHAAIGLRELQREADANRSLYKNFLNRFKESRMLGDIQQPDTKIISSARVPAFPAGVNPVLIMMACSFAGFVIAIIVCVILDHMESYLRSDVQLKAISGIDTLAVIPRIRQSARHFRHYILDNPYSEAAEAMRSMLFSILNENSKRPLIISVTSCVEREGKTVTASWIAQLCAQAGLRTILVDGNFRSPTIARLHGVSTSASVVQAVLGDIDPQQIVIQDQRLANLSIMAGIRADHHQVVSINQSHVSGFLNKLQQNYDIIIVDCAPYLKVAEAQFFSRAADLCLMAVRWDYISVPIMQSAMRKIKTDNLKISGFVLTCDETS